MPSGGDTHGTGTDWGCALTLVGANNRWRQKQGAMGCFKSPSRLFAIHPQMNQNRRLSHGTNHPSHPQLVQLIRRLRRLERLEHGQGTRNETRVLPSPAPAGTRGHSEILMKSTRRTPEPGNVWVLTCAQCGHRLYAHETSTGC